MPLLGPVPHATKGTAGHVLWGVTVSKHLCSEVGFSRSCTHLSVVNAIRDVLFME